MSEMLRTSFVLATGHGHRTVSVLSTGRSGRNRRIRSTRRRIAQKTDVSVSSLLVAVRSFESRRSPLGKVRRTRMVLERFASPTLPGSRVPVPHDRFSASALCTRRCQKRSDCPHGGKPSFLADSRRCLEHRIECRTSRFGHVLFLRPLFRSTSRQHRCNNSRPICLAMLDTPVCLRARPFE